MTKLLIIAEIGSNHCGDLDLAEELIWHSKECGADVAKFQVYRRGDIWEDPESRPKWVELTRHRVAELHSLCEKHGIEFGASVCSPRDVPWLNQYVRRWKTSSSSPTENFTPR